MGESDNLTLDEILSIGKEIPSENWRESDLKSGSYSAHRKDIHISIFSKIYVITPSDFYTIETSYSGVDHGMHELGKYYFHTEDKSVEGSGEKGDERIKIFYENIRSKAEELAPFRRSKALDVARRLADQ
ncbi:MAG: hypothetical protein IH845_01370 [Nanoarchaeota archaeon]|nr:hypothetical protein [Nanoarchaeota archaeon]